MKKLRVAIIGAGAFAATHAEAIAASGDVTLSAVCDIDNKRAKAFANTWNAVPYTTLDAMLITEKPDIVTITSSDESHAILIKETLSHRAAPRLVIVEKPLCITESELSDLALFLADKKKRLVVDHSRRFNAGFMELARMIGNGETGKLTSIRLRYYAGWFHIAVHAVDTLRMLIGEIECTGATSGPVDRFPNDPLLDATFRSKRFPDASIVLEGIVEHPVKIFDAVLVFEKATIGFCWDDITVERNGETEKRKADAIGVALNKLYGMSADMIRTDDRKLLDSAGFDVARGTMDVLFAAKRLAS